MDRCPNCDNKVRKEGSSGVLGTKNFFLSTDLVKEIKSYLPEGLIEDNICNQCVNPNFVYKGVESRIQGRIKKNEEHRLSLNQEVNDLYVKLKNGLQDFISLYSVVPKDFKPISIVESIIMFDSGARSTSSDNLNAGIWNVINDSIALSLGNTDNVKQALSAAKTELQFKSFQLDCNAVSDIKPVYSDLAANGKILLHLTGTAGVMNEFKLTPEQKSLQDKIQSLEFSLENIKKEEGLMKDLLKRINNFEFYT